MITAQELRIGNWVKDRGGKSIRIDFFEHLQKGYSCKFGMSNIIEGWGEVHPLTEYTEYAEPIPLTPEILIKAGFKGLPHFTIQRSLLFDVGRGRVVSIGDVGTPNEMVFLTEEEAPKVNAVIVLRNFDYDGKTYLHHIQNIIFALTCQELDVKI